MILLPIILVDDDRAWREALADYLENEGFRVVATASAAQALRVLGQQEAALVISDYRIPGMNGLELVRSLTQRQRRIAVLLLSSEEQPGLAEQARAAGARGFLAKSTAPRLLLRKIRDLLHEVGRTQQPSLLPIWQRLLPAPRRGSTRRSAG